jgi:hypothetical protein
MHRYVFPFVDYEEINPMKYIPALVDGDIVISDSLAISLVSYKCCFSRFSLCRQVNMFF